MFARLAGFGASVGAGSISSAGGEAVLLARGTSAMGAAAVWLSVEVMAMALRVGRWVALEFRLGVGLQVRRPM